MSLNVDVVADLVGELAALNYFPTDPAARLAIVRLFGRMAETEEQIAVVIREMTDGSLNDWPGPKALRLRFIARFRPKDGIVIRNCSCGCNGTEHGDYTFKLGPSQTWPPQIEAPPMLRLPAGRKASVDAELETAVVEGARKLAMPRAHATGTRFERELEEIITAPKDRPEVPAAPPLSPRMREDLELVTREVTAMKRRGEDLPKIASQGDVERFAQEIRRRTA